MHECTLPHISTPADHHQYHHDQNCKGSITAMRGLAHRTNGSPHRKVPVGKETSSTHCCPPQSKPSSWSLQPMRNPSLRRQYSASA